MNPMSAYPQPPANYANDEYPRRQYTAEQVYVSKDHVAAALIAIFLGALGIHKFYLGCYNAGFIMMAVSIVGGIVTFGLAAGVMGMISLIEGIIYLATSQTDFTARYVNGKREWF